MMRTMTGHDVVSDSYHPSFPESDEEHVVDMIRLYCSLVSMPCPIDAAFAQMMMMMMYCLMTWIDGSDPRLVVVFVYVCAC